MLASLKTTFEMYVSTDPNDLTPLTPANFLTGKPYADVGMTSEGGEVVKWSLAKR